MSLGRVIGKFGGFVFKCVAVIVLFIVALMMFEAGSALWIVLGIVCILIDAAIIFFGMLKPTQCPECKKFFALKEMDTEAVGSENISMKVETNDYGRNGEVVGRHEQYIPGKRITYKRNYICKKCGATSSSSFSRDKETV